MKFFRSVLITFLTNVLLFFISFSNSIVTSRFLGTSGKGVVSVANTVLTFSTIILGFGFAAANVYYIGKRQKDIESIVGNNILLALFSIVFLVPFYLLNSKYHFGFLQGVSNLIMLYVVIMIPAVIMKSAFINIFLGLKKITLFNKLNLADNGINLLLLILFITAQKQPSMAILSNLIASLTICIVELFIFIKKLDIKIRVDLKLAREMFTYGMKAQIGNFVQLINYKLDVFVVNIFHGVSQVGIYSLAVYLGQTLWQVTGSVSTVIFPIAASSTDKKEMSRFANRVTRISFTLILILSILLIIVSRPAIMLVYGRNFAFSATALLWLMPGISIFSISNILANYLAGTGKVKYNMISSIISGIITVILDFTLIPPMGIIGASLTSSLSYITFTISTLIFYTHDNGSKLSDILVIKKEDCLMIKDSCVSKLKQLRNRS